MGLARSDHEPKEYSFKPRGACVNNTQGISHEWLQAQRILNWARSGWCQKHLIVLCNISLLSETQSIHWELDVVCCDRWISIKIFCKISLSLSFYFACYFILEFEEGGKLLSEYVKPKNL